MIRSLTNGNARLMSQPPEDAWPTLEETRVLPQRPVAPPPPPPPDRRIGAGMLLAVGAIGLVAIGLLLALLIAHRKSTTPTTVVHTTTAPAERGTTTPPSTRPPGIQVPNLVGRPAAAARPALARLGLKVVLTPVTSTRPAGTIVDQAPAAGSREAKGSVVTLSVARSATTVGTTTAPATTTAAPTPVTATMPDVSGHGEQAAATSLSRAGLLASLFFVPASEPLGTVVQQARPAGASVPYHGHVQLNLSRGPGKKTDVTVPSVLGSTLTDAVSKLNGARLRLIYVKLPITSTGSVGKIVQQSPLAGDKAPQNAQVLVFLGVRRG